MAIAYIALGSNLKQPAQQVKNALEALHTLLESQVLQASSLYQTAPLGYDNQPDFINAVASVETQLEPQALLDALLAIEQQFGRERPFANAPRVLDLDLLLYAQVEMQTPTLTLPHPRMHERGFVMLPLAEIAPELILPNGMSVVELVSQCQQQGVQKLTGH
ncbi:MAG TPA: 2-amino-4-hydroxy-6-hydroxymethyldihydropteridine diphosphokinase [Methylophilus sp.]